jgi:hypothetical protein
MFNGIVVENFISKEDCDYLIKSANSLNIWKGDGHEFWEDRVIHYETMMWHDKKASRIMFDANIACSKIIKEKYNLDMEIHSDVFAIVRWFPGQLQNPHADNMSGTDITGHEHRLFGAIIYLNDNYEGGHTYYSNFDREIVPKSGTLVIHPADLEHTHGVTRVENLIRYTLASFWTFDKSKKGFQNVQLYTNKENTT